MKNTELNTENKLNILFIGDVFGKPGIKTVGKILPQLKDEYQIDFVIAQGENATGRKGLNLSDYKELKECGVDAFTMGNHVWAEAEIFEFIDTADIIRPLNINNTYPGTGTKVFKINKNNIEYSLRVTSIMGITFNQLMKPWTEEYANNFFDAIDQVIEHEEPTDFHFIDFHGETTSEKYVFGLYLDGKIDALCGTHTHVQTNDYKLLPNGTCYITDAGMTGPQNCAIGANFEEVYEKMRYDARKPFHVSDNDTQFNSVLIQLDLEKNKEKNSIKPLNYINIKL
ncbi:TIGR00282 family metallophosphoesterase [Mycoplasma hafezii]|uniref:TIGR00282 family metallophosphoesterase n=1 Tax=Mycoplasma hafezii TaxID=525886 RepID=UPI003CF4AFFF